MKKILVGAMIITVLLIGSVLIIVNFRIYPYYCWINGAANDLCVGSGFGG